METTTTISQLLDDQWDKSRHIDKDDPELSDDYKFSENPKLVNILANFYKEPELLHRISKLATKEAFKEEVSIYVPNKEDFLLYEWQDIDGYGKDYDKEAYEKALKDYEKKLEDIQSTEEEIKLRETFSDEVNQLKKFYKALYHGNEYAPRLDFVENSDKLILEIFEKYPTLKNDTIDISIQEKINKFNINNTIMETTITKEAVAPQTQSVKEFKKFYSDYQINVEAPLGHHDLYAFFRQAGNKGVEELKKLLKDTLGEGVAVDQVNKFMKKDDMLKHIIYPVKEAGKEHVFKTELTKVLSQVKSENKEFMKNYEIDEDTQLSDTDLYAFLAQGGTKEQLQQLFSVSLDSLKKEELYGKIVKPVRETNADLLVKKQLKEVLEDITHSQESKQEKKNKYSAEDIRAFYSTYEIKAESPLGHHDLYAFLTQGGTKENLEKMVQDTIGSEVSLDKLYKNEVLNKVVYPIKKEGKEQLFKEKMIEELIKNTQVQAQEVGATQDLAHLLFQDIQQNGNDNLLKAVMDTPISDNALKLLSQENTARKMFRLYERNWRQIQSLKR